MRALERAGHDVTSFAEGASAYEEVKQASFDLLLTDIDLPGQNGAELASSLRTGGSPLAVVLMAEAMWFVTHNAPSDHGWDALLQLLVGGIAGLVVYVAVLLVLRAPELSGLARRLPGGQRYMPVPSTIAPEIAEADQVPQVVDTVDVAERPSPA